jgi:hypothetical protein
MVDPVRERFVLLTATTYTTPSARVLLPCFQPSTIAHYNQGRNGRESNFEGFTWEMRSRRWPLGAVSLRRYFRLHLYLRQG